MIWRLIIPHVSVEIVYCLVLRWLLFSEQLNWPLPSDSGCLCRSAVRFSGSLCQQKSAINCNSDF